MRISVVIPSYNHGPHLRACLDSVLNQTHPPHEVIVVDDGSTDDSRDILSEYGSRIRASFQENRGTYPTLNTAIGLAGGDWIAIQNSDDVWAPEKLARQAALAGDHPDVGLVHTGFVYIDAEDHVTPTPLLRFPEYGGETVADLHPVLLRYNPIVISSTLFSRKAWEQVGPFDERFYGAGDWEFCLRVGEQFPIGYVEEPLTQVRRHGGNASTDVSRIPNEWLKRDCRIMARETTFQAANSLYLKAREGRMSPTMAAVSLASLGGIYSLGREPKLARRIYGLSARLSPIRWKTYLRYLITFLPHSLLTRIPAA